MSCAKPVVVLPVGIARMASSVRMEVWVMVRVSTIGAAEVTTTVSASAPTAMSAFTFAVNPVVNTMPSRRTVLNPGRPNVTVYVPGRSATMLYWPCESDTTVRTFSISAGLDASTVTPGRTAPEVSFTTPAIP